MIVERVLRVLGRLQRPLAWTVFGIGAAILLFEGVTAVMDVENELGSEGAAKKREG